VKKNEGKKLWKKEKDTEKVKILTFFIMGIYMLDNTRK